MTPIPLTRIASASAAVVLSTALVLGCGGDDAPAPGATPPAATLAQTRNVQTLQAGWKFLLDEGIADAQALAADPTNWSDVALPHTWNAVDAATTAQSTPSTPLYKRSVGWYRLTVDGGPATAGTQWL